MLTLTIIFNTIAPVKYALENSSKCDPQSSGTTSRETHRALFYKSVNVYLSKKVKSLMPNKGHFAVLVYGKHSPDSGCFIQSTVRCLKLFAHLYTVLKINTIWEYASRFSLPPLFHTLDFVTCQSQINFI